MFSIDCFSYRFDKYIHWEFFNYWEFVIFISHLNWWDFPRVVCALTSMHSVVFHFLFSILAFSSVSENRLWRTIEDFFFLFSNAWACVHIVAKGKMFHHRNINGHAHGALWGSLALAVTPCSWEECSLYSRGAESFLQSCKVVRGWMLRPLRHTVVLVSTSTHMATDVYALESLQCSLAIFDMRNQTHTHKKNKRAVSKAPVGKKFTRAVALSHFELQLDNYEYVMLSPLTFPLAVHYIDISNDVLTILDCSKIIDEESPSLCFNSS